MAKSSPYFPFYPDDWLDNDDIFRMTLEEEGAYIRLLASMWKRGGMLKDEPRLCCNILRCKLAKWKKIRDVLVDEIGVVYSENGCLFNERLTKELRKVEKKCQKSVEAANKRWGKAVESDIKKANKINESDDAPALRTQCHTDTDTDTDTDKEKNKEKKKSVNSKNGKRKKSSQTGFDCFWKLYPKKRSKGHAEKAWKKINPDEQLLAVILKAVGRAITLEWKNKDVQFVPYPSTWLNAKGWEDDLATVQHARRQDANKPLVTEFPP